MYGEKRQLKIDKKFNLLREKTYQFENRPIDHRLIINFSDKIPQRSKQKEKETHTIVVGALLRLKKKSNVYFTSMCYVQKDTHCDICSSNQHKYTLTIICQRKTKQMKKTV